MRITGEFQKQQKKKETTDLEDVKNKNIRNKFSIKNLNNSKIW